MIVFQNQLQIELTGQLLSGTVVSIDFKLLPAAVPKEYGYFVAIWQGSQIQSLNYAMLMQNVAMNRQIGQVVFENLRLEDLDYIIGFGVDNANGASVCATLSVPKGSPLFSPLEPMWSILELQRLASDSLIASFTTPYYNMPATNKNWVALFPGTFSAAVFSGMNVIKTTRVLEQTNEGVVAINHIPNGLIRFEQYTLIYGTGVDKDGSPDYNNVTAATEFHIP